MAVKQKDIAEKLGVSIALVSRVLSGKAEEIGIAPDTISRVLEAASEMGYVPSAAALSLKGKATRTIGVVVYDFKDPFFGAIVEQLLVQAHEHGYSLVLTGFINRTPQEEDLQPLYKHAIDGLIVIGTDPNARWLENFRHLPVARIGHGNDSEQSIRVSVDEEAAAVLLIEHLKTTGRVRPAYVCADLSAHHRRCRIMEQVAASRSIELQTEKSPERTPFAAGAQAAQKIIQGGLQIDSLICATDQVAMGALNTLQKEGIAVPNQVAVTGFDDIPAAAQFVPAITTIRQPTQKLVKLVFQAIVDSEKPKKISVSPELIVRKTA